jgi:hypothetical protein
MNHKSSSTCFDIVILIHSRIEEEIKYYPNIMISTISNKTCRETLDSMVTSNCYTLNKAIILHSNIKIIFQPK